MAKKQRKKAKYTLNEFKDIVCSNCTFCEDSLTDFCHDIYKKNPARFFEYVYPKLINTTTWPKSKNKSKKLFKNIFCSSGICGKKKVKKKCNKLKECQEQFYPTLMILIQSGKGITNVARFVSKRKKRIKKKKARYIATAYPTFFCSNNDVWKKGIQEALYGQDNIEQQDSNK